MLACQQRPLANCCRITKSPLRQYEPQVQHMPLADNERRDSKNKYCVGSVGLKRKGNFENDSISKKLRESMSLSPAKSGSTPCRSSDKDTDIDILDWSGNTVDFEEVEAIGDVESLFG